MLPAIFSGQRGRSFATVLAMKVCVLILLLCPATFAASAEVARGLAWLASQQRADGSWSTNAALNALPVLAFLSAGNFLFPVTGYLLPYFRPGFSCTEPTGTPAAATSTCAA